MPKGYYVLEVINDKNEKFYLRFYNDAPPNAGNYTIFGGVFILDCEYIEKEIEK